MEKMVITYKEQRVKTQYEKDKKEHSDILTFKEKVGINSPDSLSRSNTLVEGVIGYNLTIGHLTAEQVEKVMEVVKQLRV